MDKLSAELLDLIVESVHAIGGTIINIKRYPPGSTIVKVALERGMEVFALIFKEIDSFTLSESERQLLVNDQRLSEKSQALAYVAKFVHSMIERNIRSMTFQRGLQASELQQFIELLGSTPEELKKLGNLAELLKAKNVENITLDEKVFVALRKDQVVAEIAALEGMMDRGSVSPESFQDGTFVKYLLGKVQHGEFDLTKERLASLKKQINFDEVKDKNVVDYLKFGPALADALEKIGEEEARDEVQATYAERPATAGGVAFNLSPDLQQAVESEERVVRADALDAAREERAEKLTKTFEEISHVILSFKQPEIRSKLTGDLLKIIANFKIHTLSRIMATSLADEAPADANLKNQILTTLSIRKKSAIIDFFLQKYNSLVEGLSPRDFETSPEYLAQSEHTLKLILDHIRQHQPSPELEEKASRAISMARNIIKEAPDPEKLLILKVRRLLAKEPSYLLDDKVQVFLPDLIVRLIDFKRPDVAKKLLERLFQNFNSESPEVRIKIAGTIVRISQTLLDMKNVTLHSTLYAFLLRGFRQEKETKVYAAYLATLVIDLNRLIDEGQMNVVIQIFKNLETLKKSESDPAKEKFLSMAQDKILAHEGMMEHLIEKFAGADEVQSDHALQVLLVVDPQRIAPLMLTLMKDSEEMRIRKKTFSVLNRMAESAAPLVRDFLNAPNLPWYFVRNLIMLVGDLQDTYAESVVARHLKDENVQVRKACYATLMKLGTPSANEALAQALPDMDAAAQRSLFMHFALTRSAAGLEFMLAKTEPDMINKDEAYAADLIAALGKIPDPRVLPALKKILKPGGFSGLFKAKQNDRITLAVIRALGEIGGDEAKALIGKHVRDGNADIARAAQLAMQKMG
ncbi:MAG: HEAT repeat domain-containing protein [Myxococcales bacterium]|nr:HEAT repeat domain-containing protein [Myxococcales bacterium]